MGLRRTKRNENNATIFHSYPCFHHQWLFSQESLGIQGVDSRCTGWPCTCPVWGNHKGCPYPAGKSVYFL